MHQDRKGTLAILRPPRKYSRESYVQVVTWRKMSKERVWEIGKILPGRQSKEPVKTHLVCPHILCHDELDRAKDIAFIHYNFSNFIFYVVF